MKSVPSKQKIVALKKLLAQRYGWLPELLTSKIVVAAIAERLMKSAFSYPDEYLDRLEKNWREVEKLAETLSVDESWFFRDYGSFEYLISFVKERWRKRSRQPLKLLSIGCSQGQEPYTAIMTLLEAGIELSNIHITAVDMSQKALDIAKKGIYRANAFREEDFGFRNHYFHEEEGLWYLEKKLVQAVTFLKGNITQLRTLRSLPVCDVIFCRNTLVYFTDDARKLLLKRLEKLLDPKGIIIVGPSETSLMKQCGWIPVGYPGSFAFQRYKEEKKDLLTTKKVVVKEKNSLQQEIEKIKDLADAGNLDKACLLCDQLLQVHKNYSDLYFLRGLIDHAANADKKAFEMFKKALYLNPLHYEALVYMALLAERDQQHHRAERYRERAKRALLQKNGNG